MRFLQQIYCSNIIELICFECLPDLKALQKRALLESYWKALVPGQTWRKSFWQMASLGASHPQVEPLTAIVSSKYFFKIRQKYEPKSLVFFSMIFLLLLILTKTHDACRVIHNLCYYTPLTIQQSNPLHKKMHISLTLTLHSKIIMMHA